MSGVARSEAAKSCERGRRSSIERSSERTLASSRLFRRILAGYRRVPLSTQAPLLVRFKCPIRVRYDIKFEKDKEHTWLSSGSPEHSIVHAQKPRALSVSESALQHQTRLEFSIEYKACSRRRVARGRVVVLVLGAALLALEHEHRQRASPFLQQVERWEAARSG